ncbi:hypothetical protein [Streptomyces sp. NPDC001286]
MNRIAHDTPGESNPLRALTLDVLRRRAGMKGRTCPSGVLETVRRRAAAVHP